MHPVRRRQHAAVLEALRRRWIDWTLGSVFSGSSTSPLSGAANQTLRHCPFLQNLLVMMIEADGLQGWLAQLEAVEAQQKKHEAGGMAVPELVATAATPRLEQRPSRALLLDQVLGLMLLTVSP